MVKSDLKATSPLSVQVVKSRLGTIRSTRSIATVSSGVSEEEDYETPGTSTMATPAAEPNIANHKGKGKAQNPLPFDMDISEPLLKKRKRSASPDLIESQILADTLLAQKFQEEEYTLVERPPSKKQWIEDSDLDESELSELSEDEADLYEEEFEVKGSRKTAKRTTKVVRASRTRKAITKVQVESGVISELDQASGFPSATETGSEFSKSDSEDQDEEDDGVNEDNQNQDTASGSQRFATVSTTVTRRMRTTEYRKYTRVRIVMVVYHSRLTQYRLNAREQSWKGTTRKSRLCGLTYKMITSSLKLNLSNSQSPLVVLLKSFSSRESIG